MQAYIEYPKMMYQPGTQIEIEGKMYDTLTVTDNDQEKRAKSKGWKDHFGDKKKENSIKKQENPNEYPAMMYRPGTKTIIDGLKLDTLTVSSKDAEKAAKKDGWRRSLKEIETNALSKESKKIKTDEGSQTLQKDSKDAEPEEKITNEPQQNINTEPTEPNLEPVKDPVTGNQMPVGFKG